MNIFTATDSATSTELKLFHYTSRRRLGGEEVQLLLIHDLVIRCEWVVSVTPRARFTLEPRSPGHPAHTEALYWLT
jgi:hypothetical protein